MTAETGREKKEGSCALLILRFHFNIGFDSLNTKSATWAQCASPRVFRRFQSGDESSKGVSAGGQHGTPPPHPAPRFGRLCSGHGHAAVPNSSKFLPWKGGRWAAAGWRERGGAVVRRGVGEARKERFQERGAGKKGLNATPRICFEGLQAFRHAL